jgi:stearoyl-CoA desaturase (delta-9 desaturase)
MQNPFRLTFESIAIYRFILFTAVLYLLYAGTYEQWLIALGVYVVKGTIGTAVIHRGLSHKAFKMHKWVEYTLATIAIAGSSGSVITWVSVHRKHHRYADQPNDPHSPNHIPYIDVQLINFRQPVEVFYAIDIIRQPYYVMMHNWHWLLGILVAVVIYCIDPFAVIYAWLVPNFIQTYAAGSTVNALNHIKFGYRNFDTKDNSHNNFITGILCFGEGWHNNHHNDPANPKFGVKWWEVDTGWLFSKLISIK